VELLDVHAEQLFLFLDEELQAALHACRTGHFGRDKRFPKGDPRPERVTDAEDHLLDQLECRPL